MISIISPVKNEQYTLKELVRRIQIVMIGFDWELILVNDHSIDNSKKVMEGLKSNNIIAIDVNGKGQTGCLQTGIDNAKGDIILTINSSLQLSPEDIPRLINKFNEGYDIVNTFRKHRQASNWIKVASRCYNILMRLFFNVPTFDTNSCFIIFKKKFIGNTKLKHNDHRYLIPILMSNGAKDIAEIDVIHNERKYGKTKYHALPKYIWGFFEIFIAFVRIKIFKNIKPPKLMKKCHTKKN